MLTGYAVLFNTPSIARVEMGATFCETIDPAAFTDNLKSGRSLLTNKPIFAVVNHGPRRRKLGDTQDGRLLLEQDDGGIRFVLDARMPTGLTGTSFTYVPMRWRKDADLLVRVLHGDLREISLMTKPYQPMYRETTATIREIPLGKQS